MEACASAFIGGGDEGNRLGDVLLFESGGLGAGGLVIAEVPSDQ